MTEVPDHPRPFGLIALHVVAYGVILVLMRPEASLTLAFSGIFAVFGHPTGIPLVL